MYKSQLQEYAQKAGLMHPTYDHVKEGASHEPRFKSTVWVNNQSYESAPGFPTLRSAEHAAAKVALDFLQKTQTSGVVPSPVHESGLCKNLLQEFAQKNGYSLPQYKIMRQGEEHSLVFTATVEIAGVSYSGGGAKSKKEAEIKAARTALLAIQASQPAAAMGLPAVDPRPLLQSQPGQFCGVALQRQQVNGISRIESQVQRQGSSFTNFVKSQNKKKKRGRANLPLIEEPLATRMKQCLGQVGGPIQLPQMHPMHQVHQMHQMPLFSQVSNLPLNFHVPCTNQLAQTFQVNPVDYSGQSVMPVEWNQELGVTTRPAIVYSEPMQVGNFVPQDTAMTESEWETKPAAAQGTEPPLDIKVVKVENDLTTDLGNTETTAFEAQVTTVKTESAAAQQIPPTTDTAKGAQVFNITSTEKTNFVSNERTESLVTTELKESITVTEVHVPSASKSEVLLVQPQFSAPANDELTASQVDQVSVSVSEVTTKTSVSAASYDPVGAQELVTLANGELQSEILRAMNVGIKSVSSEAA